MADKKYYWLKLKRDFFKRHDIQIIEAMPNGKDYILFYLKLLCESVDHEGSLRFNEKVPYNLEMLSTITRTNIDVVRSAVKLFSDLGMMEIWDDGTYYMSEVERLIGCESEWAAKKRVYREKQKERAGIGQKKDNVRLTEDNVRTNADNVHSKIDNVRQEIELEKETESEREKEPDERKKVGGAAWLATLSREYSLSDSIKDALSRYADYMQSIGKPMTEQTARATIRKVNELAGTEAEAVAILDQTVRKGWKDVYALEKPKEPKEPEKSRSNRYSDKPWRNYEQRDFDYSEAVRKVAGYDEED